MKDHIRGDNLISHSPSPTWDYQHQHNPQTLIQQATQAGQDDSEELALNEEVRRISAKKPTLVRDLHYTNSSDLTNDELSGHMSSLGLNDHNNNNNSISRNITPSMANNDRSKLERICQNQSIDIFAAKYIDQEL